MDKKYESQGSETSEQGFERLLGHVGPSVMKLAFEDAREAQGRGLQGIAFSDECEGEPPTVDVQIGPDHTSFFIEGQKYVMPTQEAEALVAARVAEQQPNE